jgi:hypothetical protein
VPACVECIAPGDCPSGVCTAAFTYEERLGNRRGLWWRYVSQVPDRTRLRHGFRLRDERVR